MVSVAKVVFEASSTRAVVPGLRVNFTLTPKEGLQTGAVRHNALDTRATSHGQRSDRRGRTTKTAPTRRFTRQVETRHPQVVNISQQNVMELLRDQNLRNADDPRNRKVH